MAQEIQRFLVLSVPDAMMLPAMPFACLFHARAPSATQERARLAALLVASGRCRAFVCVGTDAADWETAFDDADVECLPEAQWAMTTAHGDDLDDAVFFFTRCVSDVESRILVVWGDAMAPALLSAIDRAHETRW